MNTIQSNQEGQLQMTVNEAQMGAPFSNAFQTEKKYNFTFWDSKISTDTGTVLNENTETEKNVHITLNLHKKLIQISSYERY